MLWFQWWFYTNHCSANTWILSKIQVFLSSKVHLEDPPSVVTAVTQKMHEVDKRIESIVIEIR